MSTKYLLNKQPLDLFSRFFRVLKLFNFTTYDYQEKTQTLFRIHELYPYKGKFSSELECMKISKVKESSRTASCRTNHSRLLCH